MSDITLQQQINCVTREIKMREIVYPGRVRIGKMKQENADYEIAAMRAVLATLTRPDPLHPIVSDHTTQETT
jgi:hypothetical protein